MRWSNGLIHTYVWNILLIRLTSNITLNMEENDFIHNLSIKDKLGLVRAIIESKVTWLQKTMWISFKIETTSQYNLEVLQSWYTKNKNKLIS